MPYPETTIVRHLRSRLVYVFIFPQVSFANAHSTSRLSVVLPLQGKLICIFNDRFGLKSHAPSNVYDGSTARGDRSMQFPQVLCHIFKLVARECASAGNTLLWCGQYELPRHVDGINSFRNVCLHRLERIKRH